ncbi:MAG: four-carbon acid sugar kinase family protein [Lachnospiraceae bacterium]
MPIIGGVADDLTGATTTGVVLARSKARTAVFFNEEAALNGKNTDQLDAIIISSNSRALPCDEAYEKVKSATLALKKMEVKYYQKRIDTTCRGGIGIEIDAMLDQLEDTIAIVVPAMPQSRRILVGGYSVIDGVALINTPVAQDVRTPVKENYIPRLLAEQTRRNVGLITLDQVLAGTEAIKNSLIKQKEKGNEVIVIDAISIEDVNAIAKSCVELEWNILSVDPGPFTSKLAYNRNIIKEEEENVPQGSVDEAGKTVIIAAGSATPVTKKQMEILTADKRHRRISVEPLPLIEGGDKAIKEAQKAIEKGIELLNSENQPRAILFETALHGDVLDLDEEDSKRGYANGMSADRINAGLGTIVSNLLETVGREKIAGLYTTGGDTMVNVCYQLGVECLEMLDYVIPQTDVTRLIGKYDGLPAIGKGGLTGKDDTACEIVNRLFRENLR